MPSEVRILPSPPVIAGFVCACVWAGIAQLVEREPSKLGVAGSNPVSRSIKSHRAAPPPGGYGARARDEIWAHVAQSVEHFLGKEEVTGSNPVVGLQNPTATRPVPRHSR